MAQHNSSLRFMVGFCYETVKRHLQADRNSSLSRVVHPQLSKGGGTSRYLGAM